MKAKRILKQVTVNFISLVAKGANNKVILWKSANDDRSWNRDILIKKVDEEKRLVYGIVYSPDQVDSQGDVADAAVIEKMAYDFMQARKTNRVDAGHDFDPDEGFVAESWIVKGGDPLFPIEPVGSWAVGIKVLKEETWAKVKAGEITGLSMAGSALAQEVEKSFFGKVGQFFTGWLKKDFDSEMKNKELIQAVWTLIDSIQNIVNSSEKDADQKQADIMLSIEQFKAYLGSEEIEKEGKVFSKGNIEKIRAAAAALKDLIDLYEKQDITKGGDNTVDEKQIQELIEKALAPLREELKKQAVVKIEDVQKAMTDAVAPVAQRVEVLEKATPGTQIAKGQDQNQDQSGKKPKGLRIF